MQTDPRSNGRRGGRAALSALVGAGLLVTAMGAADATHPPRPYFSLARGSASFVAGESPADTFQSPKSISLTHAALGLKPWVEVDGVSNGEDYVDPVDPCPAFPIPGTNPPRYYSTIYSWSVDKRSKGATQGGAMPACVSGGQPERTEAVNNEVAADVFIQLFDPFAPGLRANYLFHDESELGLKDGNRDEVDALEGVLGLGLEGTTSPAQDVYFTVDRKTAARLGVSPADILFVPAGGTSWSVQWTANDLGLNTRDNVNGLCVSKHGPRLLVSLDRSSPSLALGGYSAADIFKVVPGLDPFPGSGISVPFLTNEFLSLLHDDDVDGFDCDLGDPGDGRHGLQPVPDSDRHRAPGATKAAASEQHGLLADR